MQYEAFRKFWPSVLIAGILYERKPLMGLAYIEQIPYFDSEIKEMLRKVRV